MVDIDKFEEPMRSVILQAPGWTYWLRCKPMNDQVLIVRLPPTEQSEGGIVIPEEAQHPGEEQEGFVVAIGSGRVTKKGVRISHEGFEVGDRVLIEKYARRLDAAFGTFDHFVLVNFDDIIGVVE